MKVEDLSEERRVELMVAAVKAGVVVTGMRQDETSVVYHVGHTTSLRLGYEQTAALREIVGPHPTIMAAYAAAALALGLEPKWRVVDKRVADEWLRTTAELNRWNWCERSEVPEFKDRVIACQKMSAVTAALVRALGGEVTDHG